ncbi:MAG: hypothetical protein RL172_3110 [Bacteroidota bacterium]|jgi:hypothetical protein
MQLLRAIPILPARSLKKTVDFFESKLGFKGSYSGLMATVEHGSITIYFEMSTSARPSVVACCLIVTDNLQDLYGVCAANDLLYPPGKLSSLPYGKLSFSIKDNNGNIIRFEESTL